LIEQGLAIIGATTRSLYFAPIHLLATNSIAASDHGQALPRSGSKSFSTSVIITAAMAITRPDAVVPRLDNASYYRWKPTGDFNHDVTGTGTH